VSKYLICFLLLGIDWRSVNSGVHIRRPDEDTDVAFCRSSALWTNSSRHHRWPPGSSSRELFITFSSLQHFLRFWYPLHCLYGLVNWMAAYLGYTLLMKTLFRGWPIMVHDKHTRRREAGFRNPGWYPKKPPVFLGKPT